MTSQSAMVSIKAPVASGVTLTLTEGQSLATSLLLAISPDKIAEFKTSFVEKNLLAKVDWSLVEIFGYEGFDPSSVYRHILAVIDREKMSLDMFEEDLGAILILQAMRGNVTSKNYQSFSSQGKQAINILYAKYNMKLKLSNAEKRTAVTLPRISLAFPFQASIVADHCGKSYTGPFRSDALPSFMKTNSFASLIPTGMEYTSMLFFAYTCYSSDQSAALAGKNFTKTTEDEKMMILNKQFVFSSNALNSVIIDQDNRLQAMDFFKVHTFYAQISKVVKHNTDDAQFSLSQADWDTAFAVKADESTGPAT